MGKILCTDLDDVLIDLLPAWVADINRRIGTSVSPNEITDWDISKFFPCSRSEIFSSLSSEAFWGTVKPKEDALRYLPLIIEELGYEAYVCTSTHPNIVSYKISQFFPVYFPQIDWKHIIIAHNKDLIECDVMVDDGVHNLICHSPSALRILYTTPPNKSFCDGEGGILRMGDWGEIYTYLKSRDRTGDWKLK